jgi:hypothetical protein
MGDGKGIEVIELGSLPAGWYRVTGWVTTNGVAVMTVEADGRRYDVRVPEDDVPSGLHADIDFRDGVVTGEAYWGGSSWRSPGSSINVSSYSDHDSTPADRLREALREWDGVRARLGDDDALHRAGEALAEAVRAFLGEGR